MRAASVVLAVTLAFASTFTGTTAQSDAQSVTSWPVHNNGNNSIVEWDHYSYLINGKRLYIFGGEFHYWRFPVPELWEDLLQKIKAAGFNSFSIYSNWAYHSPSPNVLDFSSGSRNFTSIFELAKKIGLYVLYRPGPYVNAETNAGGFPLWLTTGAYGSLRNNDTRYTEAWKPYMAEVSKIVAPYLITNGGNVIAFQIENELGSQWIGNPAKKIPDVGIGQYMDLLEEVARENGIDIPLSFNNPNMNSDSWSMDFAPGAEGNVDIVGLDSYPSCWSCNLDECTSTNGVYAPFTVQNYYDYFTRISPTQPNFLPEFQGGSYNPWGGPEGGCPQNSNEEFANLFYRHNIAERVTAQNLYMLYGGTSWGYLPAPVVATSYDYSAPISENRLIGAKYYETKLLALFLRAAATNLAKTDRIGNNTSYSTNSNVFTTELRNPDTMAGFYVTIHSNSSIGTKETFHIHVNTSIGALWIPKYAAEITLDGHQSKIIVTDFPFGEFSIVYSTAEILTTAIIDGIPTLAFWLPAGESGEIAFKDFHHGKVGHTSRSGVSFHQEKNGNLILSFTQAPGINVVELDGNKIRVLLLDRTAAYKFWVPSLNVDPFAPEDENILVHGPYLVRGATINGKNLALSGDIDSPTNLTVYASKSVKSITWNGHKVEVKHSTGGALVGYLGGLMADPTLPALTGWKTANNFPEKSSNYSTSSSAWITANKTVTPNPQKPYAGGPVLYVDDYAIHVGTTIFRTTISGAPSEITLGLQGGTAFGFSVFLNSKQIGSFLGNSSAEAYNMTLSASSLTILPSQDNVLVVIMDNSGHALRSGALDPRGILLASITNGTFGTWKIAGTAGRETNIDPVRGSLNEGGLTSERLGWHLPGFNTSAWDELSPLSGVAGAGVQFYVTKANLSIPAGLDVSISFTLEVPSGSTKSLRGVLWVNGYQFGLIHPSIGNQVTFPVPTGILDTRGENTIAVSVWNQADGEVLAKLDVGWKIEYAHETGYDFGFDASALRPGWVQSREVYV